MANIEKYHHRYYNNTSVAYDHVYLPEPPAERVPQRKVRSFREERLARRARSAHRFKLVLVIIAVFAGCITLMCAEASVESQRMKNKRLAEELSVLRAENAAIEADMSDELSIEYIKSEAINRLGMVEPQDYQIIHVTVPELSYTVSHSAASESESSGFSIRNVISLFKGE
ncbi:MAG: hypothetical protein IJC39_01030 [Firmicutes bacterium]|nr:hypothetical protein [Bacillota bacterium]